MKSTRHGVVFCEHSFHFEEQMPRADPVLYTRGAVFMQWLGLGVPRLYCTYSLVAVRDDTAFSVNIF